MLLQKNIAHDVSIHPRPPSHNTIVSFTFLASTEDEVAALIENRSLSPIAPKSHPKTTPAKKVH
jgi:hypothetical protein